MGAVKINPRLVKLNRPYLVDEVASLFGISRGTVREWQKRGLTAVDGGRPILFAGHILRAFLEAQKRNRKISTPPGQIYCVGCRSPRVPAEAIADYQPRTTTSGMVTALCPACGSLMHRPVRLAELSQKLPGVAISIRAMATT